METNKKIPDLAVIKIILGVLFPYFLILITGELRPSVSDYAYSKYNAFFFVMLGIFGTMIFDGGYINRKNLQDMFIGGSLIGVALTPHLDYTFLHYVFAGIFFILPMITNILFINNKQKFLMIILTSIMLFGMMGHFIFNWYSLFWAESIGFIPIAIRLYLQRRNKIIL